MPGKRKHMTQFANTGQQKAIFAKDPALGHTIAKRARKAHKSYVKGKPNAKGGGARKAK